MKVAHIIFSFNTGGAETMLVDIVNEQKNHGDICLIIINNYYSKELLKNINSDVKVYFINRKFKSINPFYVFKLNILLIKLSPHIIHCHNHNIIPLLLPILYRKTLLTIHDTGIESKYLRLYRKVFAISSSVQDDIYFRSFKNIKCIVVNNGISINDITFKNELNFKGIFKIVQVSRLLHEKKGQDILLKALSKLTNIEIQIDFIGDGPSKKYLLKLTKDLGLEGRVRFLGEQTREFIYDTLKDYHLLIQPSRYEGFGLTVAEGMAAKVPVLVSDIEGPMELICDGKYGFCFKNNDSEDLSNKISALLSIYSSDELKLIVDNAYKFVIENYSIKTTANKYIEEYKKK